MSYFGNSTFVVGISHFDGQVKTEILPYVENEHQGRKSIVSAFISIWSHSLNPNELREIKVRFWADISEIGKTYSGSCFILIANFVR